jgi:hypothetical protein
LQGDGGTFRLRIATQKLELLTGTLIAGINSSYVAVVAGILYCAMLRSSCWPAIRWRDRAFTRPPVSGRIYRHSTACTTDPIRAFVRQ